MRPLSGRKPREAPNEQRDDASFGGARGTGRRTADTQVLLTVVDKCDRQALGYPLAVAVRQVSLPFLIRILRH
jgi:hypothetical protein